MVLEEVLIIDDERPLARAYARLFDQQNVVVAHSASAAGAVIRRRSPRLCGMVVDLRLPDGSGFDLLELFRKRYPVEPAIVVTAICTPRHVNLAHRFQAGFVVKPFCTANIRRFARQLDDKRPRRLLDDIAARFGLTPRECDILERAMAGIPRSRLADALGISENTIKSQVRSLLLKTGHRSIAEAVWELRYPGEVA